MARVRRQSSGALRRLTSPEGMQQITAALFAGGQIIENAAALSITEGSVSGRSHVRSAPGGPPNADTHVLDRSIETNIIRPGLVEVSANAEYAKALEFGTSKMAARPFMRPAANEKREEVTDLVRRAMRKIARGGTVTR